jgi:hypothetical protein
MILHPSWFRRGFSFLGLALLMWGPQPSAAQLPDSPSDPQDNSYPGLAEWAMDYLDGLAPAPEGATDSPSLRVERIGVIYLLSVDDGDWLERGRDSLQVVKNLPEVDAETAPILRAYEGALEILRAKHSRWPPNKLKFLGRGSEILDDLVLRNPDDLRIRYLRYASYRGLPFFLSRDQEVRDDFQSLVQGLPGGPGAFSPAMHQAVLRLVLDDASLADADAIRLKAALTG